MRFMRITSILTRNEIPSVRPLKAWLLIYEKELYSRQYKQKTITDKLSMLKRVDDQLGQMPIGSIRPKNIQQFIQKFIDKNQYCTAKHARVLLLDMFREAIVQEWIKNNPVTHVAPTKVPVARSRLLHAEWLHIYNAARVFCMPYVHHSMLLSLVTAQRRADISKMRRCDIYDDHLHIIQQKTGMKVALPLSLYCAEIDISLREVIAACPGEDYLLSSKQVMPWSLSQGFRAARDIAYPVSEWESPPTLHEQRSLSERLYRDQGINTLRLLGHKSQRMTDDYNDDRGREFRRLVI